MDQLTEKTLSTKSVYDGKIIHVYQDQIQLPNGHETRREVVRMRQAVCVVPVTTDGRVVVVRQFRYPYGRVLTEIPAGKLEPGETPEQGALRELQEETGVQAAKLQPLGELYPTVAVCDEVIHMFLATELKTGDSHTDEDEFLEADTIPLQELIEAVMSGQIRDSKTQAALLKAERLLNTDA